MAYFMPTIERTSAEGVTKLFQDNIWKPHGFLESIIMDRGGIVCGRNDEGVELYARNRYKTVNSLSSANKWPN